MMRTERTRREYAYDRESSVGRLDKGFAEAADRGWTIVDIKKDWSQVYPQPNAEATSSRSSAPHHYFAKDQHDHRADWGYSGALGPRFWGQLDPSYRLAETGQKQSPIDIDSRRAQTADLPELLFDYQTERIVSWNNGHTIQHNESPGSFLNVGDKRYALEQFHVHVPSEHTIDGKRFDMEIHFVHKSESGDVAVVAVLARGDKQSEASIPVYEVPSQTGEMVAYRGRRNPTEFLPTSREFFSYDGSFTTPPCTEGVKWFVMKNPIHVRPKLIHTFQSILQSNNRPVQAQHGREIQRSF